MKNSIGTDLSGTEFFDYWSTLAKEDPERFERERREAIKKVISQASPERQKELWRFQCAIDLWRVRAKDPLVAAAALFSATLTSLNVLRGLLKELACNEENSADIAKSCKPLSTQ